MVLNKAVVTEGPKFEGDESVRAKVDVGDFINIVEIEECPEDKRLRARIEQPPGWVSLVNTETGRRWAQRALVCPRGHVPQREHCTSQERCDTCGSTMLEGTLRLVAKYSSSSFQMCPKCVFDCSRRKAWTYHAVAGLDAEALGFQHEVQTPFRVLVTDVEAGLWADNNGLKVGDELLACNGIRVDKMEPEELANLFISIRPLKLTFLWDAHQVPKSPGSAPPVPRPLASAPQRIDNRSIYAPHWGISRAQCQELLRLLRKDPNWDSRYTMEQLVTEYIVPKTRGSGLGYALWKNREKPKEANVVVTYAWSHNAENCLETILRSTYSTDVLFMSALALYQAQDSAGPGIEEQLGGCPSVGPFHQTLSHIAEKSAFGRCCWRQQSLIRALPPILLGLALALFWVPVAVWGCIPSYDFDQCVKRTQPDRGWTQDIAWDWQSVYVDEVVGVLCMVLYSVAAGFLVIAAGLSLVIQFCFPFNGRLIAVPNQEDKLCGRLWSIYFIHLAQKLKVPAFLAHNLASTGHACASQAKCEVPGDQQKVLRLVEEDPENPDAGYAAIDHAVRALQRNRRWAVRASAFHWAALFALVRSADLRLVANEPARWETSILAPALAVLGAWLGAVLCALSAYSLLRRTTDDQRLWVLVASPGFPSVAGCVILVALLLSRRLQIFIVPVWSAFFDLLTDEAYRHSTCTSEACQYIVAFTASLGQTLLIGGNSLGVFVIGTLACPSLITRWQCPLALLAAFLLLGAAFTFFYVRSLQADDFPASQFWHAVTVFHLVQLLARFVVPVGSLCAFAYRWGWPRPRPQRELRKEEIADGGATPQGRPAPPPLDLDEASKGPEDGRSPLTSPSGQQVGSIASQEVTDTPRGWMKDGRCFPLAAS